MTFVEDAGDTLHCSAEGSRLRIHLRRDEGLLARGQQPVRWLGEGRDPSATLDSANAGFGTNEGDNEITGVHVSDGDPSQNGLLGAKVPTFGNGGWRWFYTQQHGDNFTWEVLPAGRS